MRHNKKGRKLGTDYSHTKAMKTQLGVRPVPERPHQDGRVPCQGDPPAGRQGDHLGQARRPALPPSGHRLPERQGARPRDLREGRAGHVPGPSRAATPAS